MSKITARFTFRGRDRRDIPVLNPGAHHGHSWLLVLDTAHEPDLFIVEADGPCDALDALADDEEYGDLVRIQAHELGDYGLRLAAGTLVDGVQLLAEAIVNLRGEVVPEGESEYVREPQVSASGTYYDGESLLVFGDERADVPFPCAYHGEELPVAGVGPKEYTINDERSTT